ncbi:hypothetical protein [Deinococcus gobiensis]|uniref:Uncharacterized protein n=1 Tax=Deinococcus gobiensis (strain DSM 21396 / JCM 16679 / CGMCC 1.7299 / I-0) TaxID=745776 RepID=H8H3L6_DEIGI|nr:hypothetical protein [Deinococcus gobiensis]AFD28113.1 hypothetical protein DGo_PD0039 [Deinococcus gobiensis I-0]
MQSRFFQELHQRRQAAALVTQGAVEREAFITGLLSDTQLVADAVSAFLARLKQSQVSGPLFSLAVIEARSVVLRTAHRRCDDLLSWQEVRSPLAGWWGLQASFEYNNDGRRFAEGLCGYLRSTRETFALDSDHHVTEAGDLAFVTLVDDHADPALRFERSNASRELYALLSLACDSTAAAWLRDWLRVDALDRDEPVVFSSHGARLCWHYGAQRSLASDQGVTERTLRNRSRRVELMLSGVAQLARAA